MRVYKSEDLVTVKDAPVGLFLMEGSGEIICITEYHKDNGQREAYLISSRECYCGGDGEEGLPIIIS